MLTTALFGRRPACCQRLLLNYSAVWQTPGRLISISCCSYVLVCRLSQRQPFYRFFFSIKGLPAASLAVSLIIYPQSPCVHCLSRPEPFPLLRSCLTSVPGPALQYYSLALSHSCPLSSSLPFGPIPVSSPPAYPRVFQLMLPYLRLTSCPIPVPSLPVCLSARLSVQKFEQLCFVTLIPKGKKTLRRFFRKVIRK